MGAHIDISCPKNLSIDDFGDDVELGFLDGRGVDADARSSCHGIVGQKGECGDHCCEDMEEAFLLYQHIRKSDL